MTDVISKNAVVISLKQNVQTPPDALTRVPSRRWLSVSKIIESVREVDATSDELRNLAEGLFWIALNDSIDDPDAQLHIIEACVIEEFGGYGDGVEGTEAFQDTMARINVLWDSISDNREFSQARDYWDCAVELGRIADFLDENGGAV